MGPNSPRGGTLKRVSLGLHPVSLRKSKEMGWNGQQGEETSTQENGAHVIAQDKHQPPAKVGRGTYRLPTCSAHANGGATKVKKRFSLAARHRFFGQAPKKWGRIAGQANDHLPTYRRTRTKRKTRRGKPLDRVSPLNPLPDLYEASGGSALCGARPEALPLDSTAFEKAGETFIRASRAGAVMPPLRGRGNRPGRRRGGRARGLRTSSRRRAGAWSRAG